MVTITVVSAVCLLSYSGSGFGFGFDVDLGLMCLCDECLDLYIWFGLRIFLIPPFPFAPGRFRDACTYW
ncbi:hypothetical protein B0H10DRAFT_2060842 [Mycena sp. CBHHK59/15]|nr:hypothetical protein B0H10DRAFT_2060842 [Mycena sp. CBHHK59/15]